MDCSPARVLCPWGFSGQEYWSGLPCPSPGHLPDPGIESISPTLQVNSLPFEPPGMLTLKEILSQQGRWETQYPFLTQRTLKRSTWRLLNCILCVHSAPSTTARWHGEQTGSLYQRAFTQTAKYIDQRWFHQGQCEQLFSVSIFIMYLFGCARSWLWHMGLQSCCGMLDP